MKYRVRLKETRYGSVTVQARSPEEAKLLAENEYAKGRTHWIDSSVELRGIEKEKERGDER
jgi:hypothetical protein